MTPTLLTLDEVCDRVKLSPWAVRRAIKDGELDAMKLRGRLRVTDQALAAWLEASTIHTDVAATIAQPRPLPRQFPREGGRLRRCLEDEYARR